MPDGARQFFAQNEKDTAKLGEMLAGIIAPDDVIVLSGELGTGKSALARALIRAWLKAPGLEVPSPTYLLVLPYENEVNNDIRRAVHADLYRLEAAQDLAELGLYENQGAVVLIEWPQRAPRLFDEADMAISIDIPEDGTGRNFLISSYKYQDVLAGLATIVRR